MTAAQCERCHRPLRDEASQRRRYGPVCYRRTFGAPPPAPGRTQVSVPAHITTDHPVDPNQLPLPLEDLVDAETHKAAIDTIARHAISRSLAYDVTPLWENYPLLDLNDWNAVITRIQAIGKSLAPSDEGYDAAYEHLAKGASTGEPRP